MIFTALTTTTIYKQPDNTKGYFPLRLKAGETGKVINAMIRDWYQVETKGVLGYVEAKYGTVSTVVPPPAPPPPPAPEPSDEFVSARLIRPDGTYVEFVRKQ